MAEKIDICNMALGYVGSQTISTLVIDSITDPSSKKSIKLCNLYFDIALEEILTRYRWHFALKRATPSLDSATPDFEWQYQFHKPIDCLRVIRLTHRDQEFKVEGDLILANSNSIQIQYIKKIVNFGEMDSYCVDAVAHSLAMKVAVALRGTEGAALVQTLDGLLETRVIAQAKKAHALEENTADFQKIQNGAWVDAHKRRSTTGIKLTAPVV